MATRSPLRMLENSEQKKLARASDDNPDPNKFERAKAMFEMAKGLQAFVNHPKIEPRLKP